MADDPLFPPDRALWVADLAVRGARRVWGALPGRLRKDVEDRVFYIIFQRTRVENDAYGWRPPDGGGSTRPAGESPAASPVGTGTSDVRP